jgi:hypothetical protein
MQVTLVQCSTRLMGEKLWKSKVFISATNGSKWPRIYKSHMKTMLINFFDIKGIVHCEFIQKAKQSSKLIMWKYWGGDVKLCVGKGLNFGPPTGFSTMTVLQLTRRSLSSLAQKSITEMEHPPYSSDMALNNFSLFTKIKSALKWRRFQENWRHPPSPKKETTALKAILQQDYQKCLQQWQHRWAEWKAAEAGN